MKKVIYLFIILSVFAACKKEKDQHSVVYKVTVIAGAPTYSVHFTSFDGVTTSQGPFTESMWVSSKIDDFEAGDVATMKLEGKNGGSYKMYVYVDGTLQMEDRMDDPYGPKTISVEIPN